MERRHVKDLLSDGVSKENVNFRMKPTNSVAPVTVKNATVLFSIYSVLVSHVMCRDSARLTVPINLQCMENIWCV